MNAKPAEEEVMVIELTLWANTALGTLQTLSFVSLRPPYKVGSRQHADKRHPPSHLRTLETSWEGTLPTGRRMVPKLIQGQWGQGQSVKVFSCSEYVSLISSPYPSPHDLEWIKLKKLLFDHLQGTTA